MHEVEQTPEVQDASLVVPLERNRTLEVQRLEALERNMEQTPDVPAH